MTLKDDATCVLSKRQNKEETKKSEDLTNAVSCSLASGCIAAEKDYGLESKARKELRTFFNVADISSTNVYTPGHDVVSVSNSACLDGKYRTPYLRLIRAI